MGPQSIRVMCIIARLNIGGPAIHVIDLYGRLKDLRYDPILVTGTEAESEGSFKDLAIARGLRVVVVPELGREISLKNDLVAIRKLYYLMQQERPHIVHTHTAKAGFIGRLAAWLARVPVVCHTFHGHVLHGYFGATKNRFFLELEKFGSRLSSCIITLSGLLRDELVSLGVTHHDHIAVIPLGFELQEFARQKRYPGSFRKELGLSEQDKLVAVVGRLVKIKNIPLFLEAAAKLRHLNQDIHFAVVGDGEEREKLESYARSLGLERVVHFTGWRHDLPKVYADLDVTVISSNNEGTPVSLIEAMAVGCPVVATRVGGVPDLLDNGRLGILVPPGNGEAMGKGILQVFRDEDTTKIRTSLAKKYVLKHYSSARLIADMDRLYLDLLRKYGLLFRN